MSRLWVYFLCHLWVDLATGRVPFFLPNATIPTHYQLNLFTLIDDTQDAFNGSVNITVNVRNSVNQIVLHSNGLTISEQRSRVWSGDDKSVGIRGLNINPVNQFLTINLKRTIPAGHYVLQLYFNGTYNTKTSTGIFKAYYKKSNGRQQPYVATSFEAVYARQMFPCFDEPKLKATFQVQIVHYSNLHAISNMPVASVVGRHSNTLVTTFETTPKMSTYLLAVGVSDFETLEEEYHDTKIHLYTDPDSVDQTIYALHISKEAVRHLESIFQVPFPMPKLDGILIPIDYPGGMENWGLILYHKSEVLSTDVVQINDLLCHEIAHQWIGDLVTLEWWDYAWLNEGFVVVYTSRIDDLITPNQRFMENIVILCNVALMNSESRANYTLTLNDHVEDPLTIFDIKFQDFTYAKGASIVRFMWQIFPNYDRAITDYIVSNAYGNTVPKDVFDAINDFTELPPGMDVGTIMNNWVNTPGVPLITMNVSTSGNITTLVISQERFLLDGSSNQTWWIPITLITKSYPDVELTRPIAWIGDTQRSISLNIPSIGQDWVIGNYQQVILCRINYDLQNWQRIIDFLMGPNYKKINALNRMALVQDIQQLAIIGKVPQSYALNLLAYVKHERDPLVRETVRNTFVNYADLLRNTPISSKYKTFMASIYGQKDAENALAEPYWPDALSEVLATAYSRLSTRVGKFAEFLDRIYTESHLEDILDAINNRPDEDLEYLVILATDRYRSNKIVKNNFLESSYNEVVDWLEARY